MEPLTENILFQNFISPTLCKELVLAGFKPKVNFYWKGYVSKHTELVSNLFDPDSYYTDGQQLSDSISPPAYSLPAFTIKDIEKELPAFCMTSDGQGNYEIMLDKNYEVPACTADRLPDAFGKIFLQALNKHVINLQKINSQG
jgi:hypothetical protein